VHDLLVALAPEVSNIFAFFSVLKASDECSVMLCSLLYCAALEMIV